MKTLIGESWEKYKEHVCEHECQDGNCKDCNAFDYDAKQAFYEGIKIYRKYVNDRLEDFNKKINK